MGVFTMPSLGADMDSGRIVEWYVQPGDKVHRGDVLAVVDTTKAAIEVEVFEDGTVTEILVEPGTEVDVGTPLAMITADADQQDVGGDPHAEPASSEETGETEESGSVEPGGPRPHRVSAGELKAMPPVRHLAHQLGVDLESLTGSGPGGKITRKDVEAAASTADHSGPGAGGASGSGAASGTGAESVPQRPASEPRSRPRATPRARRLAAEHGIELGSIAGSGTDGAITGPDVEKTIAESAPEPAEVSVPAGSAPESGDHPAKAGPAKSAPAKAAAARISTGAERKSMRRAATAALMARSAREIPHYYVSQTVELTRTLDWLRSHNAGLSVRDRVLPAALFLRATVQAAQEVEEVNGHWVDDAFVPANGVQLGVAVAMRDGGLLTPVIIDAHLLGLDELMAHLADLVRRARSGRLRSREIEPGSITVSSLADGGPDALFGVIYPPQVALVGIGGVAERPWAVDGALAARPTVTLTVAADHRATDGRIGAKFLGALSRALTRPEEM